MALPSFVQRALTLLNEAGYEAYVVGGCVRDSWMGLSLSDWDITTSALPTEIATVFGAYRMIHTGIQHGTVTVIIENTPLEITTYRVDGTYTDGRHPSAVTFTSCLQEDLKRRDFTINAMAYHPREGLVDPFGGQEDIQCKIIRCVGVPSKRFGEDALRILRALRFAAVLGFDIERETASALHSLSDTLCQVSVERIAAEFKRLICGAAADTVCREYNDVLAVFLPEIRGCDTYELVSLVPPIPRTRIAALFCVAGMTAQEAQSALRRLRLDTQTIREVTCLLSFSLKGIYTEDAYLLRLLNHMGPELVFDYFAIHESEDHTVSRARQLIEEKACYAISMLAVKGDDLLFGGVLPGPAIGAMLQELLYAVMDGRCSNTKEALLDYVKTTKKPVL